MGTQINMPISSSDNLIGSLQFHNRFYNYFNNEININNTPHTYTIPIIYNTFDSSQNYINDFSVNQRNDNLDNQDMDNQYMDNLNRNITNSIDALTNIISDLRNTNVSNHSISSLEELNSHLTDILKLAKLKADTKLSPNLALTSIQSYRTMNPLIMYINHQVN